MSINDFSDRRKFLVDSFKLVSLAAAGSLLVPKQAGAISCQFPYGETQPQLIYLGETEDSQYTDKFTPVPIDHRHRVFVDRSYVENFNALKRGAKIPLTITCPNHPDNFKGPAALFKYHRHESHVLGGYLDSAQFARLLSVGSVEHALTFMGKVDHPVELRYNG